MGSESLQVGFFPPDDLPPLPERHLGACKTPGPSAERYSRKASPLPPPSTPWRGGEGGEVICALAARGGLVLQCPAQLEDLVAQRGKPSRTPQVSAACFISFSSPWIIFRRAAGSIASGSTSAARLPAPRCARGSVMSWIALMMRWARCHALCCRRPDLAAVLRLVDRLPHGVGDAVGVHHDGALEVARRPGRSSGQRGGAWRRNPSLSERLRSPPC